MSFFYKQADRTLFVRARKLQNFLTQPFFVAEAYTGKPGEYVTVAIANPLDAWALSAIEKAAGFRKVEPILVLERELQAVCQAYKQRALQAIEERLTQHGDDQAQ